MAIENNPDPDHKMKVIVRWLDKKGRPYRKLAPNRLEGEIKFLLKHGQATAEELAELSCRAVVEHHFLEQERRGQDAGQVRGKKLIALSLLDTHLQCPFGDITVEDYRSIRERLESHKTDGKHTYTPLTVLNHCKVLEQICNRAQTLHIIGENRARVANETLSRRQRLDLTLSAPTHKQMQAIRLHSFPISGAMVDLMAEAGAGTVDLVRVEWTDVDHNKRLVRFRGLPTIVDPEGKTMERFVPMSTALAASLLRWRFAGRDSTSPLVFPTGKGPGSIVALAQIRAGLTRDVNKQLDRQFAKKPTPKVQVYRVPNAKYSPVHFRNYAAQRWAKNLGLKTLAYRLGITVKTADRKYGSQYNHQFAEDYLLARRRGEMMR